MKHFYFILLFLVNVFHAQNKIDTDVLEINFGGSSEPDHIMKINDKVFFYYI